MITLDDFKSNEIKFNAIDAALFLFRLADIFESLRMDMKSADPIRLLGHTFIATCKMSALDPVEVMKILFDNTKDAIIKTWDEKANSK